MWQPTPSAKLALMCITAALAVSSVITLPASGGLDDFRDLAYMTFTENGPRIEALSPDPELVSILRSQRLVNQERAPPTTVDGAISLSINITNESVNTNTPTQYNRQTAQNDGVDITVPSSG